MSAPTNEELRDADRYRALREFLTVARDADGDCTCWLELQCVPYRSQTNVVEELVDRLVQQYLSRVAAV
jgi:hypothetical protein